MLTYNSVSKVLLKQYHNVSINRDGVRLPELVEYIVSRGFINRKELTLDVLRESVKKLHQHGLLVFVNIDGGMLFGTGISKPINENASSWEIDDIFCAYPTFTDGYNVGCSLRTLFKKYGVCPDIFKSPNTEWLAGYDAGFVEGTAYKNDAPNPIDNTKELVPESIKPALNFYGITDSDLISEEISITDESVVILSEGLFDTLSSAGKSLTRFALNSDQLSDTGKIARSFFSRDIGAAVPAAIKQAASKWAEHKGELFVPLIALSPDLHKNIQSKLISESKTIKDVKNIPLPKNVYGSTVFLTDPVDPSLMVYLPIEKFAPICFEFIDVDRINGEVEPEDVTSDLDIETSGIGDSGEEEINTKSITAAELRPLLDMSYVEQSKYVSDYFDTTFKPESTIFKSLSGIEKFSYLYDFKTDNDNPKIFSKFYMPGAKKDDGSRRITKYEADNLRSLIGRINVFTASFDSLLNHVNSLKEVTKKDDIPDEYKKKIVSKLYDLVREKISDVDANLFSGKLVKHIDAAIDILNFLKAVETPKSKTKPNTWTYGLDLSQIENEIKTVERLKELMTTAPIAESLILETSEKDAHKFIKHEYYAAFVPLVTSTPHKESQRKKDRDKVDVRIVIYGFIWKKSINSPTKNINRTDAASERYLMYKSLRLVTGAPILFGSLKNKISDMVKSIDIGKFFAVAHSWLKGPAKLNTQNEGYVDTGFITIAEFASKFTNYLSFTEINRFHYQIVYKFSQTELTLSINSNENTDKVNKTITSLDLLYKIYSKFWKAAGVKLDIILRSDKKEVPINIDSANNKDTIKKAVQSLYDQNRPIKQPTQSPQTQQQPPTQTPPAGTPKP